MFKCWTILNLHSRIRWAHYKYSSIMFLYITIFDTELIYSYDQLPTAKSYCSITSSGSWRILLRMQRWRRTVCRNRPPWSRQHPQNRVCTRRHHWGTALLVPEYNHPVASKVHHRRRIVKLRGHTESRLLGLPNNTISTRWEFSVI